MHHLLKFKMHKIEIGKVISDLFYFFAETEIITSNPNWRIRPYQKFRVAIFLAALFYMYKFGIVLDNITKTIDTTPFKPTRTCLLLRHVFNDILKHLIELNCGDRIPVRIWRRCWRSLQSGVVHPRDVGQSRVGEADLHRRRIMGGGGGSGRAFSNGETTPTGSRSTADHQRSGRVTR